MNEGSHIDLKASFLATAACRILICSVKFSLNIDIFARASHDKENNIFLQLHVLFQISLDAELYLYHL